jgi:hypothetical protein
LVRTGHQNLYPPLSPAVGTRRSKLQLLKNSKHKKKVPDPDKKFCGFLVIHYMLHTYI